MWVLWVVTHKPKKTFKNIIPHHIRGEDVINSENVLNVNTMNIEKYFLNILKSNQIWIVLTLFRLILQQTKFRLVPDQSENVKYNLISVDLTRFRNDFSAFSPYKNFVGPWRNEGGLLLYMSRQHAVFRKSR